MNKATLIGLVALMGFNTPIFAEEVMTFCEYREVETDEEIAEAESKLEEDEVRVRKNGYYLRSIPADQPDLRVSQPDDKKVFIGEVAMTEAECNAVIEAATYELLCAPRSGEKDGTLNYFMYNREKGRFFGTKGMSHEMCIASLTSSSKNYSCGYVKRERAVEGKKDEEGKPVMEEDPRSGFFVFNMDREVFAGSQGVSQEVCAEIVAGSTERYTCGNKVSFRGSEAGFYVFDTQTLRYVGSAFETAASCLQSVSSL